MMTANVGKRPSHSLTLAKTVFFIYAFLSNQYAKGTNHKVKNVPIVKPPITTHTSGLVGLMQYATIFIRHRNRGFLVLISTGTIGGLTVGLVTIFSVLPVLLLRRA